MMMHLRLRWPALAETYGYLDSIVKLAMLIA